MNAMKLGRRDLLIGTGGLAGVAIIARFPRWIAARPKFSAYPFTLGVASGDPLPDSVVLWTRLAPDPLNGGGMPAASVPVQWQVATDPNMRRIVRRGTARATPDFAHSVHIEVDGLQPDRFYWYQFRAGNELSPIGRTRTAPAPGAPIEQLTFAFASCQDWQNGFYPAHKHLAEEDLNFVVFLGDYIYGDGAEADAPRQHSGSECITLDDYRNRYAQYKTDPNLQAAHAAFPWIVTWDDHEVDNNYADLHPANNQSREAFVRRRANAYRAYYEHMPLRPTSLPDGSNLRLHRRFTFGDLAQFHVLDTRQYRTDQPCGDGAQPRCPGALAEAATMMGTEQERWLLQRLDESPARWNVIAQQVMMAQFDFDPRPRTGMFNMDQWDGYVAARNRLVSFLQQRQPANPVVITGDIHSSWVNDLKADFNNPDSATVGTEFVGTSLSSAFPADYVPVVKLARLANPHNKFFEGTTHGYVRCQITREGWQSDYRVVSSILEPDAAIKTMASFLVEHGKPGAQRL